MDFRTRYGPWAIVAGASEGTGRSFARGIAARGVNVLMLANGGPLEEEAEAVARDFGVEAIPAFVDLAQAEAIDQIIAATGNREVGLYVSNAGTDYFGKPFFDSPLAGWLDMIAVNTSTMVKTAHHFGGLMRGRGRGGLLMVNSGACYMGGGRLAIYTACKGFQLNFCQSLWTELRPHGVDVLSLVLGKTDTPNYHALQRNKGMPSSTNIASPDDVAEQGLTSLPQGPVQHVGLADDEAGYYSWSAAQLRERVLAMDAAIALGFGAK